MGAWNEFYERLCKDYNLNRERHFWLHRQSQKYVIFHHTVRIIAKQDGIRALVVPLSETTDGKTTHILSGAVAWIPGSKKYCAHGTSSSIIITGPDEEIELLPDLKFKMNFKAEMAASEIGEGDSSNYLAGYKRIIVDKRAYDRAVLELIQHKYEYSIITDQDADIIDGTSQGKEQQQAESELKGPVDDSSEVSRYSQFRKQVQQWIRTVGIATAQGMVASSMAILDTITEEHRAAIYLMLAEAEKTSCQINAEKAAETDNSPAPAQAEGVVPPAKEDPITEPAEASRVDAINEVLAVAASITNSMRLESPPAATDEEMDSSTEEEIARANGIAETLWKAKEQYHLKTAITQLMPDIKKLPQGLRTYLTRVKKAKGEFFKNKEE